jgi:hypothetical protein
VIDLFNSNDYITENFQEIGDIKLLPYFKIDYLVNERESVSNTWMSYYIL